MRTKITDKPCIAFLAANGVCHNQLSLLRELFEQKGATTKILADTSGYVVSSANGNPVTRFRTDGLITGTDPRPFSAVIVPCGQHHAEALRAEKSAYRLLRMAWAHNRLVGAAGWGITTLSSSGLLEGIRHAGRAAALLAGTTGEGFEVTSDMGIITCTGKESVHRFGNRFLDEIRKELTNGWVELFNVRFR